MGLQNLSEAIRGELEAPITVDHGRSPGVGRQRRLECFKHKLVIIAETKSIGDYTVIEQIKNRTHEDTSAGLQLELCHIGQPFLILELRNELSAQSVLYCEITGFHRTDDLLLACDRLDPHQAHEAQDAVTAVCGIQVAIHQVPHHAVARDTIILDIERSDACGDGFILNLTLGLLAFLILIIRLPTDISDRTQLRDGVAFAVQLCDRFMNPLSPNSAYLRLLSSSSNFFRNAFSTSTFFRLRRSVSSALFS